MNGKSSLLSQKSVVRESHQAQTSLLHVEGAGLTEVCLNPWKSKPCFSSDIAVYIVFKTERIPICRRCWLEIAASDIEWDGRQKNEE